MKNRLLFSLFISIMGWAVMAPAFAGDLVVTRYFSGLWDQTHEESQGIVLHVVDQEEDGNPKAVAYWFTYGDDLETSWYMAIGQVDGNQVLMELYASGGVDFMQPEASDINPVEIAGTLVLTFKNCNKGTAYYDMGGDMQGEFEISRLASLYNSRCSGGISDNTPSDAKPLMLEVDLLPPSDDMMGKGKAKFWERADRMDFHVSAEGIPDGEYVIRYCSTTAPLVVEFGEGATQFRSPEAAGQILLVEDPRGCQIDITQGEDAGMMVYLTSGEKVLSEKETGPKEKADQNEVKLELVNTGVEGFESAEGEVEYKVEEDSSEFEIEIEDVPAGTYYLFVDTLEKGQFDVNASGKAKLKFSDPEFIIWNATIEVTLDDKSTVILEIIFPGEDD